MKYITPDWPAPKNVKAFSTTRLGWGKRRPHHQQNDGNFSASIRDYVVESDKIVSLLGLPSEPLWIHQTHSTIAIEATLENREKNADASFTNQPKHVCAIVTADCLPVLICDKRGTRVAAAHAGWRGLANGIIENTIHQLQIPTSELLVWLGPAIGPEKFEVGRDVHDAFVQKHPESATAFKPHQPEKWLANLYELARLRLALQGVPTTGIYGGNHCTFTQDDLFFSYRRDKGHLGRIASVIWFE